MADVEITVNLPEIEYEMAKTAADAAGISVSAYIARAVRDKTTRDAVRAYYAHLDREGLTPEQQVAELLRSEYAEAQIAAVKARNSVA